MSEWTIHHHPRGYVVTRNTPTGQEAINRNGAVVFFKNAQAAFVAAKDATRQEAKAIADAQHTPGPWPKPEPNSSDYGGGTWYEIEGVCEHVWRQADAQLIAAAPKLLQALRGMIAYVDRLNEMSEDRLREMDFASADECRDAAAAIAEVSGIKRT